MSLDAKIKQDLRNEIAELKAERDQLAERAEKAEAAVRLASPALVRLAEQVQVMRGILEKHFEVQCEGCGLTVVDAEIAEALAVCGQVPGGTRTRF